MAETSDQDLAKVLAGGRAYLQRTKGQGSGRRTTDIALPNESGIVDPTIATRQQTRKEQPRGMTSNVQLRRALTRR